MKIDVYSLSVIFSVIFMICTIELVRRNRLHEKYSLLWLLFSIILIFLAALPGLLESIAFLLDIKYAPSLLFLVGLVFLILYSLSMTISISKQGDRIIKLTQELSILKERIKSLEAEKNENK